MSVEYIISIHSDHALIGCVCVYTVIHCDEYLSGHMYSDETLSWSFENTMTQTVTFSNCQSNFDTKMYLTHGESDDNNSNQTDYDYDWLYDSDDDYLNSCSDDCGCDNSLGMQEQFTMNQLEPGTYTLSLEPYDDGGHYKVMVICDRSGTPQFLQAMMIVALLLTMMGTVRIKWRYCCCKWKAFIWFLLGTVAALAPILPYIYRMCVDKRVASGRTLNCDIAAFVLLFIMTMISKKLEKKEGVDPNKAVQSEPMMEGL